MRVSGTMKVALRAGAPLCAAAVLALAACPRPTDGTPQIAVSEGAAKRLGYLPSKAPKPAAVPSANARARAHTMDASPSSRLGGPNATGRPGDWVLENDEVVFVIDALSGGGGFAESGGNLVDAADARARKDELAQLFTYFGLFPRQAVYSKLTGFEEPDGTAVVEARGRELYEAALEVVTQYRLAGSDRAMLMRTTLTNGGKEPITLPGLGDAIQWGGVEKVAPGRSVGFKGPSTGAFIGGIGRFVSYGVTATEGDIAAVSGGAWTDTEQRKNVTIAPGASVTYERVFAVGERGDVASIVAELTKASGGEVGAVEVAIVDASGRPVTLPAGAKIAVLTPKGDEVMGLVSKEGARAIVGELPPGRYLLAYAPSAGRRALGGGAPARASVVVKKDEIAKAELAVTEAATLAVSCSGGAEPCKVTVLGASGTTDPWFGPSHVAEAAKNQIFAVRGAREVPIAPGTYELTFSRGPEHAIEVETVTVAPGTRVVVDKVLRRVLDTTGYVGTDFHQHTSVSADAAVAAEDRVIANVAEGVEVAVVSEHNVVADFSSIVARLSLGRHVVHVPGDEVTTDASKKPWGHMNVFPLAVDPAKPRSGAPAARDTLASDVVAEVRALPGGPRVVQVNHPRSGQNGYFDLLGFEPKTGEGTGAGYARDFDAIEVWNGRNVEMRTKVLEDYLALLRTSHPVTAIAATDTHGVVGHEAGLPRTYVRVASDTSLETWDASRTADLVASIRERRDVILTNGPFLAVTANGAGVGAVARARAGGLVDVTVRVTSAPFVAVERLEVRVAGAAKVVSPSPVSVTPKKNAAGAMEATATFRVRASSDDALVVIAHGSKPMRPMFTGEDAEIAPWAMTGAIWIDADGDGRALGRR